MPNKSKPSYYAVIPANVRYDDRLVANEKLLYGEIASLSDAKGYCHAQNAYFAGLYGVAKATISSWIGKLIDCGYITSEITFKDGTMAVAERKLRIAEPIQKNQNTPSEKSEEGSSEKSEYPIQKIPKDNNTSNNNTSIEYKYIVDFLNEKAGTGYRLTSKKTRELINARINEGFTVTDFETVIIKKCAEWLNTNMAIYLRPETLFGNKFEGYLNQPMKKVTTADLPKRGGAEYGF